MIVNYWFQAKNQFFYWNQWSWNSISDWRKILMSVCRFLIFKMLLVLLVILVRCQGSLEKIVKWIENFCLLCRFEIAKSIGNFFLAICLKCFWFFGWFELISDLPILVYSDVFVESFGLDDFGHQQCVFYYIWLYWGVNYLFFIINCYIKQLPSIS